MCTIEQALPYVALAVLCPAAYEGMARAKLADLVGSTGSTARPHVDEDQDAGSSEK